MFNVPNQKTDGSYIVCSSYVSYKMSSFSADPVDDCSCLCVLRSGSNADES